MNIYIVMKQYLGITQVDSVWYSRVEAYQEAENVERGEKAKNVNCCTFVVRQHVLGDPNESRV